MLACAAVRVLSNVVGAAFFIWVIAGGLDAYAGSYDALAERFGFTLGERGTLVLTAAGLLVWGAFASIVQVGVYRRGLRDWPDAAGAAAEAATGAGRRHARPLRSPRGGVGGGDRIRVAAVGHGLAAARSLRGLAGALAWATSRPDGAARPDRVGAGRRARGAAR